MLPTTQSLTGVFAPSSDQPWLTIGNVADGVIHFAFPQITSVALSADLTVLGQQIPVTKGVSLLEGPGSGADSDMIAASGSCSAASNASWLHTAASGSGNGLAGFTFDANNSGATRTGTLTVAGQTLTVTQAGSGYVAANPLSTLASGFTPPQGMAVDNAGNVYIAEPYNNVIKEWNATSHTVSDLFSGLNWPDGVAVDSLGNVYVADDGIGIVEWYATTHGVGTLVPEAQGDEGMIGPFDGVAVDSSGNVYFIAGYTEPLVPKGSINDNRLYEWNAGTQTVNTLVTGLPLGDTFGVAVDGAGNVYYADKDNNVIEEWQAANQTVTNLLGGLSSPEGVAVDGSGNVDVANAGNNTIEEWNATTQRLSIAVSAGLNQPSGVAVDGAGNVYITDNGDDTLKELPRAFIPGSALSEGAAAGSDQLSPVLPTSESLTGIFAPSSDQSWLSIGSITNGVIDFSFNQNTGAPRTAHITVLGQQITVNQAGLGTTSLLEGPAGVPIRTSSWTGDLGSPPPTLRGCTLRPAAPAMAWPASPSMPTAATRAAAP